MTYIWIDPNPEDSESSGFDSVDDTHTETSDNESDDSESDSDEDHPNDYYGPSKPVSINTSSGIARPSISIAPVSRYRTPPPRPISASSTISRSVQTPLSTSAPMRPSILRKQSEGSLPSLLSVPTNSTPTMRQRSGSHSEAVNRPSSHLRFMSDHQEQQNLSRGLSIERSPSPLLLNSPSWSASVGVDKVQFLDEKERKRQEAIHELITTERVYLAHLYLVRDEFQRPLLDQGLINPLDSESLFMEWSSLLDLSQSIVDELAQRQESEGGIVLAVGDVINSHIVERAGCFMRYCANHREGANLLARKLAESRLFSEFIMTAKSKPSCRGMDISSFLLQPLQRITRYPLLIKKILEYTPDDHIDHLLLSEALVSAESFLDRINESIRRGEDKQKLEEIQRKLPNDELSEGLLLTSETKFLGPRRVLLEGGLRKAKSGRKLYAYLCNDLLLLFVPRRSTGGLTKSVSYTSLSLTGSSPSLSSSPSFSSESYHNNDHGWALYHAPIPLERLKGKPDTNDETKFTLIITSPVPASNIAHASHVPLHLQPHHSQPNGPQQSLIHVKASSTRERKAWLNALQKAIEDLAKAPRDYGMRTSIRPSLAETIGTMTIRINEGIIPNHEFAKTKSFICTISLGSQLFTTRPSAADHPFSEAFSIFWRESTIFAVTDMSHSLNVKVMSTSPFSPDVFMGSAQIPFHTVVPYGERGTEVITMVGKNIHVKFHMSFKPL